MHDELLSGSAGSKVMAPGRVLVLALPRYQSHVAVVLKVIVQFVFRCLALRNVFDRENTSRL